MRHRVFKNEVVVFVNGGDGDGYGGGGGENAREIGGSYAIVR